MSESHIKKTTLADVVENLCKRPGMYTMGGSFNEVIAFLEGYTTANRPNGSRLEWHGFNRWTAERCGYQSHIVAAKYLREKFPDDRDALANLATFYRQYADDMAGSSNK